MEITMEVSHKI
ncbi:rCG59940, partial [Rattus norvegicus]